MGRDLSYRGHNVVVLVSSNGLFPPEPEEVLCFQQGMDAIRSNLKKALETDGRNEKDYHLLMALNYYPFPLKISDGERDVYSNQQAFELPEFPSNAMAYPLDERYTLWVAVKDDASVISDFHHHQRIALLGELLNTLKHELSNPLFGLQLGTDLLKQEHPEGETLEFIEAIGQNASRCQRILTNFQGLFGGPGQFPEVNLEDLIRDTIKLAKSELKGIQINLEGLQGPAPLDVKVNPTWIGQIIFNLLINAAQACKSQTGRTPCIEIEATRDDSAKRIRVAVKDNGPGVKNEHRERLFAPFFTTKEDGTGLGLSICKRLAEKHDASILFCNNDPLPGATFSLNLPYANPGH